MPQAFPLAHADLAEAQQPRRSHAQLQQLQHVPQQGLNGANGYEEAVQHNSIRAEVSLGEGGPYDSTAAAVQYTGTTAYQRAVRRDKQHVAAAVAAVAGGGGTSGSYQRAGRPDAQEAAAPARGQVAAAVTAVAAVAGGDASGSGLHDLHANPNGLAPTQLSPPASATAHSYSISLTPQNDAAGGRYQEQQKREKAREMHGPDEHQEKWWGFSREELQGAHGKGAHELLGANARSARGELDGRAKESEFSLESNSQAQGSQGEEGARGGDEAATLRAGTLKECPSRGMFATLQSTTILRFNVVHSRTQARTCTREIAPLACSKCKNRPLFSALVSSRVCVCVVVVVFVCVCAVCGLCVRVSVSVRERETERVSVVCVCVCVCVFVCVLGLTHAALQQATVSRREPMFCSYFCLQVERS